MRLAHQSLQTGAVVMVETHSRALTDVQAARIGESPPQSVAFRAAVVMVNLTLPVNSVPRPPGLLHALANHADELSKKCGEWPQVPWRVDGVAVTAHARRFAGGWAAVSDAVDGVYLAAMGLGASPEDLALAALEDGRAYNFDLNQSLHPQVIVASSAARTGGERLPPLRQDWHADQVRLIASRS
jgi:hypothetical protein